MACNDLDAIDRIVRRLNGDLMQPTAAHETGLRLASHAGDAASAEEIAQVPFEISSELKHFWRHCREAAFFRDVDYDQWGLDILAPLAAVKATQELRKERPIDIRENDLVIGRFRGDSDFVIIRCGAADDDFGYVVVGLPLDRRADWYFTEMCLSEFLRQFVDARGQKFWEARAS